MEKEEDKEGETAGEGERIKGQRVRGSETKRRLRGLGDRKKVEGEDREYREG